MLDFLERRFPRIGREVWRRRLEGGAVKWRGRPLSVDSPYLPEVELQYWRETEEEPPVRRDVEVVWSDDHLLVVDKPPFLPVTPGGRYVRGCLLTVLEERLGEPELAPLHRLDKDTSGLVVLSRRAESRGHFGGLFQGRGPRIQKEYLALCELMERAWLGTRTLSHHVRRDPTAHWRQRVDVDLPANARSELEVVEVRGSRALVRLRPRSGRKHQLRVQLAHEGLPIVNDRVYGSACVGSMDDLEHPMALVCHRLWVVRFPGFAGSPPLTLEWSTPRRPWSDDHEWTACRQRSEDTKNPPLTRGVGRRLSR